MTAVLETLKLFSSNQCLDLMKYLVVNGPTRYNVLALEMYEMYGNASNVTNLTRRLKKAGHVELLIEGKTKYYVATIRSGLVKAIIDAHLAVPTTVKDVSPKIDPELHLRTIKLFGNAQAPSP